MFEGIRRKKNAETLSWHLQKIDELVQTRRRYEMEGDHAFVLAVNYELVSHASRALVAVRKLEELGGSITDAAAAELRQRLSDMVDLPAMARDQIDSAEPEVVKRLYAQYREAHGSTRIRDRSSGSGLQQLDPTEHPLPDPIIEQVLEKWVETSGRRFDSEAELDELLQQLWAKWLLLSSLFDRGEDVSPETAETLAREYEMRYSETGGSNQFKQAWIAAHLELQHAFLAHHAIRSSAEEPSPTLCTRTTIIDQYRVPPAAFERKYNSYQFALTMTGASSHWNEEIDEFARDKGILNEAEIEAAHHDFNQAVLNRVKVAFAVEGSASP